MASGDELRNRARDLEDAHRPAEALEVYLQLAAELQGGMAAANWQRIGSLQESAGDPTAATVSYARAVGLYASAGQRNNALALCEAIGDSETAAHSVKLARLRFALEFGYQAFARNAIVPLVLSAIRAGEDGEVIDQIATFLVRHGTDERYSPSAIVEQLPSAEETKAAPLLSRVWRKLTEAGARDMADRVRAEILRIDAAADPRPDAPPPGELHGDSAAASLPLIVPTTVHGDDRALDFPIIEGLEPTHAGPEGESLPREPRQPQPESQPEVAAFSSDPTPVDEDPTTDEQNALGSKLVVLGPMDAFEDPAEDAVRDGIEAPPEDRVFADGSEDPVRDGAEGAVEEAVDDGIEDWMRGWIEDGVEQGLESPEETGVEDADAHEGDEDEEPEPLPLLFPTGRFSNSAEPKPAPSASPRASSGGRVESASEVASHPDPWEVQPTDRYARRRIPGLDLQAIARELQRITTREVEPSDAGSHYDVGVAFKEMGMIEDAIGSLGAALAGGHNPVATLEVLGEILIEQGRYDSAARILEFARSADPEYDEAIAGVLYWLARSDQMGGRREDARALLARVVRAAPAYRDASHRLAALYAS